VTSSTGSTANDWLFTGEQEDGETGLYFLRARYYDPETGRFLARDPLEFNQRYAYAGNNPATMVDPSGLVPGPDPDAYYKATRRGTCAVLGWFRTSCDETNESTLGAVDAAADRVEVGVGRVAGGIDDSLESVSDAGQTARNVAAAVFHEVVYYQAVAQELENKGNQDAVALGVHWVDQASPACKANVGVITAAWLISLTDWGLTAPWAIGVTSRRAESLLITCFIASQYDLDIDGVDLNFPISTP
jgi:RHS repeat-associated protein